VPNKAFGKVQEAHGGGVLGSISLSGSAEAVPSSSRTYLAGVGTCLLSTRHDPVETDRGACGAYIREHEMFEDDGFERRGAEVFWRLHCPNK
jgi:hypothetical protein